MQKIININFQGRVIPIEEDAYDNLKRYMDGLRAHFAKEESSDEIINDIENRIAELFTNQLKRGAGCIVNSDVNLVINNIGRLEDIETSETDTTANVDEVPEPTAETNNRFFRSADDKVIAGVCSGIAARIGVDPVVIR